MTHFVIYQLTPDHATYGSDARKFIVTSEDLEREFSGPMGEDDARTLASALNACQTVTDRWERGDLAEAARLCAAVAEDVNGRVPAKSEALEPLLLACTYIEYVKECAPDLHRKADGTPSIEAAIKNEIARRQP